LLQFFSLTERSICVCLNARLICKRGLQRRYRDRLHPQPRPEKRAFEHVRTLFETSTMSVEISRVASWLRPHSFWRS
jgi:hypothetical protein